MEASRPSGIYLYSKERSDIHVLKDLMQLMKSVSPGKSGSFAYVEAQTSLIPHLSLWENLQLEAGGGSWQELAQQASAELRQLMNLVVNHDQLAQTAQAWEKFSISLLKGIMMPSPHILLDMNEDLLSPIMIPLLKKILIKTSGQKKIFLASAHASLWLDCCHCLVTRQQYEFKFQQLDEESIRRHWVA